MNTYVYEYKDAIYINLTNRCTNNCAFCIRNDHNGVGSYDLKLDREPKADEIIKALNEYKELNNVVFCGLGEPTLNLDVLLETAEYLKNRGVHVRLNTNGHGSVFSGSNIAHKLKGLVDVVSISLNASCAAEYQKICKSIYGERAYDYLLDFAKDCAAEGIETILSVVDIIGEDEIERCRHIADQVGAKLRVRKYID